VYPKEYLSLKVDQGVTDFTPATKTLNGTNWELIGDGRYDVDNTFIAFDEYDLPLTTVGRDGIARSTHWGFKKSLPVVQASNAYYNHFVFSNFETDSSNLVTGNEFTVTTPPYSYPPGRTGNYSLPAGVKLSKVLTKSNVTNYVLSFWQKTQLSTCDFHIELKNAPGTSTYYNNTITVNPSSTDWQYFQIIIPMAAVLANSFMLEVQGVNIPSGATPIIDDVAFYPENANLTSYTYAIPFGQNSITDGTHTTVFSTFDDLGRGKFILDQDKNIVQKKSYKYPAVPPRAFTASISVSSAYDFTTIQFSANQDNCIDDVTYEWDFGNGFQNLGPIAFNSYTTTGSKSVSLRKTHLVYGTVTTTVNFAIGVNPNLSADLCAKGAEEVECTTRISSFTCNAITDTPANMETYWKVPELYVNGNLITESVQSYVWYKSIDGGASWSNVGSTQTIDVAVSNYLIKCFITTTTGRSGYTNVGQVTAYCH
jgi:hypothetical protein